VTAASTQDRDGAIFLFNQLKDHKERLQRVYADSAYAGALQARVTDTYGLTLEIVRKPPEQIGFAVQPKRWVVERTNAWSGKSRRLSKDYEFKPEHSEAVIYWSAVNRMTHTLGSA